jgi:hypothetical protein
MNIEEALEQLTGSAIDINAAKGRYVWGRAAFRGEGMLHVQLMPGDKAVNDAVMPTITGEDTAQGMAKRIYRERCQSYADDMNAKIVREQKLILLVSSNGYLTRTAKALIAALL